jgi:large subunit ribosomal protein LX
MKVFKVEGEIKDPKLSLKFEKEVMALSDKLASEKVYSDIGSRHRIKRYSVRILSVKAIDPKDAEDPVIRRKMEGVAKGP